MSLNILDQQLRMSERLRIALMQEEFPIPTAPAEMPLLGRLIAEPITNGYSPVCPTFETGSWVLGLDALTEHGFDPRGRKPAPRHDPDLDGNELSDGDILVSRSNTRERVGQAGLYNGEPPNCFYPDLMMRIRVDLNKIRPEYLDLFLRSEFARRFLQSRAGGTSGSMVKIKERDLRQLPVALPAPDEQEITVTRIRSASMLVSNVKSQICKAHRVKQSLLQNLLTGKVRLKT
jgi:type I restriction enzyme S subunit